MIKTKLFKRSLNCKAGNSKKCGPNNCCKLCYDSNKIRKEAKMHKIKRKCRDRRLKLRNMYNKSMLSTPFPDEE